MPNKMLVDATHPEETRVVVLRGNRVEEFDFESASRRQLRGNIYLAKVTRVEPSLQAAFVDYGGNRHGFLAFSEIHPDYYQIPVADRQALIEAEEAEMAEAEARANEREKRGRRPRGSAANAKASAVSEPAEIDNQPDAAAEARMEAAAEDGAEPATVEPVAEDAANDDTPESAAATGEAPEAVASGEDAGDVSEHDAEDESGGEHDDDDAPTADAAGGSDESDHDDGDDESEGENGAAEDQIESVGAEDAMEEVPERRRPRARQYKIQEVIKRRQVLLVQVVKEERGNKGAALTTYLSLAGRYSVLMPNTARGGGISRKITSITDRKRLKQVVSDLEVPPGMGVILRTAGAARTRAEVKRDFEYLLRLWENVRELTLKSTAPALVYEEGSLIKRSIRDLYNKDIDEVLVAGDDAYREAKDFMRMLMPSHAKNVKPYKEPQPIFARSGIEAQLDAMFSPQVTLRSGGYIVINQTEALVSIDVNSGRATREHNIEDTALQTNLEAVDEVARQLRLRDLAGLVVIDFIDMEEKRNNRSVERKVKDALKNDRARIQVGRISHFGLLEMSRQRIRTGVVESTTSVCPTCQGTGHVRAPASVALHVLRSLEDQLLKGATHNLTIRTRTPVALYILNQKRAHLADLEQRFHLAITVTVDETIANGAHFVIERGEPIEMREPAATSITPASVLPIEDAPEEDVADVELEEEDVSVAGEEAAAAESDGGPRRRRRRRGRRGGSGERRDEARPAPVAMEGAGDESEGDEDAPVVARDDQGGELGADGQPRKRRRGRRGGRRGRRGRGGDTRALNETPGRPSDAESESNYPDGNFTPISADDYEIDTTPSLDDDKPGMAPRRLDVATFDAGPPDEVDTTPRLEDEVRRESVSTGKAAPDATPPAPAPEPDDDNAADRPKRSGWWQRRSFF